jgi:hypothetical protein
VGPIAAVALHALWESSAVASQLPPTLAPLAERYRTEYVDKLEPPADRRYMKVHGGHMMYVNPGEEQFLTPEVIQSFSLTAPREQIIEQIRAMEAAGLKEVAFCVLNDNARGMIEELSREIVAKY